MQPRFIVNQPVGNPFPVSSAQIPGSTNVFLAVVISLPILLFLGALGMTAHEKRRATVLKQYVQRLEKTWELSCDRDLG